MSPSNMLGQMKQKQHTCTHTHTQTCIKVCMFVENKNIRVISIPPKGAGPEGLVVKELLTYCLLHCGSGHERVNHILSPSLYFQ